LLIEQKKDTFLVLVVWSWSWSFGLVAVALLLVLLILGPVCNQFLEEFLTNFFESSGGIVKEEVQKRFFFLFLLYFGYSFLSQANQIHFHPPEKSSPRTSHQTTPNNTTQHSIDKTQHNNSTAQHDITTTQTAQYNTTQQSPLHPNAYHFNPRFLLHPLSLLHPPSLLHFL
jgi:hypothetical protein